MPAFAALLRGDGPPPGAEPLTQQSLRTVFVHAARSLAGSRPTIVLIEDLHFAPDEGRSLFTALAHAVPGHRVLLLGTARPGLPAQWYAEMERREHVAKREVRRLDVPTVERHLSKLLGATPHAERLASRIAGKADGNPFFVFEMLRTLRESGVVSRADDGRWSVVRDEADLQIPSSIRGLVAGRLAGVDADDREILEAAACQGAEFDGRLVAEALGRPRLDVLRRLGRLERETGLVRAAGPRFAFDHHLVHEVLYETTAPALREELHAATADAIERQTGAASKEPNDPQGEVCVDLAGHWLKSASSGRAGRYLAAAQTHLENGIRHAQAADLTEQALAVPDLVAGAERASTLVRLCRPAGPLDRLGRRARPEAKACEAERVAAETADERTRGQAAMALGWCLHQTSRLQEAEAAVDRSIVIARSRGDRSAEAAASGILVVVLQSQGRLVEARTHAERQIAVHRELGDRGSEAWAVANLAGVLWSQGLLVEAGEAAAAKDRHLSAVAVFEEIGHRHGVALTHLALRILHRESGEDAVARTWLTKARDELTRMGVAGAETQARCHLACLPGGDWRDAAQSFTASEDRLEAEQRRNSRWLLWQATGDRAHLAEAKRLLDEAVANVPEDIRTSMLTNLRRNREIVAAAREAGF